MITAGRENRGEWNLSALMEYFCQAPRKHRPTSVPPTVSQSGRRSLHAGRNKASLPDTMALQVARESVGLRIEFGIGQALILEKRLPRHLAPVAPVSQKVGGRTCRAGNPTLSNSIPPVADGVQKRSREEARQLFVPD